MKDEIKVGDYVRTTNGIIAKIIGYDDDNNFMLDNQQILTKRESKRIKHSSNINELVEEGDILKYKVNNLSEITTSEVKLFKDVRKFKEYLSVLGYELERVKILSIITHEQLKNIEYTI